MSRTVPPIKNERRNEVGDESSEPLPTMNFRKFPSNKKSFQNHAANKCNYRDFQHATNLRAFAENHEGNPRHKGVISVTRRALQFGLHNSGAERF